MKGLTSSIISLVVICSYIDISAQPHLDVEGDVKIRGKIDIVDTSDNVFIGENSGINLLDGQSNTFLGKDAGSQADSAYWNVFIGKFSGRQTSGSFNTFLGVSTGLSNTSGEQNTFVGRDAGWASTKGSRNVFVGDIAGFYNGDQNQNVFVGAQAGYNNRLGDIVGIGFGALNKNGLNASTNPEGVWNTAVGTYAGFNNDLGFENTFIGFSAGKMNTNANGNTFVGSSSGSANVAGTLNTFLGTNSGMRNITGGWNTIIGAGSGEFTNDGHNNSFLGTYAGFRNTTGSSNVFLGRQAGENNTDGSHNVLIGDNSTASDTSATNQVVIGSFAGGNGDNMATIGNDAITDVFMSEDAGATVHAANAKLNSLPANSLSDSILVLQPDSTLAVRETSSLIQSFGQMGGSPIAFGFVDINGNLIKSTGNISASFSGDTGNSATSYIYSVSVTAETLTPTSHIVFITPVMVDDTQPNHTRTSGVVFVGGSAKIRFFSTGNAPTSAFNIMVYKY
jgi:hypothetical protein